jgi:hypothetical protein
MGYPHYSGTAGGLQTLIGTALVDSAVHEELLRNPLALANRFDVGLKERRFLASIRPRSLEHFAALVEEWLDGASRPESVPVPAYARAKVAG